MFEAFKHPDQKPFGRINAITQICYEFESHDIGISVPYSRESGRGEDYPIHLNRHEDDSPIPYVSRQPYIRYVAYGIANNLPNKKIRNSVYGAADALEGIQVFCMTRSESIVFYFFVNPNLYGFRT